MDRGAKSKIGLYIALVVIFFVLVVGAFFIAKSFASDSPGGSEIGRTSENRIPTEKLTFTDATETDFKNFEEIIEKNAMIQDLPDSGVIQLSFYTFDGGQRVWQKYYAITKGSVTEGAPQDPDINLVMHSKYLTALNQNNFCRIVQTAKNNGDFYAETFISTTSLIWRYKGMMDYKDCLGL